MEENLWEKYEKMVRYNSSFRPNKNYYESVKVWNAFYNGDQWIGLEGDSKLPHPEFNIIKRITEFKIASLTSSDIAVNIEPLENAVTLPASEQVGEVSEAEYTCGNFRLRLPVLLLGAGTARLVPPVKIVKHKNQQQYYPAYYVNTVGHYLLCYGREDTKTPA